jgi:hypothetical protein
MIPFAFMLRRVAEQSRAAEDAHRAAAEARTRLLETQRRTAFRRLSVIEALAKEAERHETAEVAEPPMLAALFRALDWVDNDLSELPPEADAVIEQAKPLIRAVHAERWQRETDIAPDRALATLEAWHREARGREIFDAMDRFIPDTPRTDW